jgi:hypothetical protein
MTVPSPIERLGMGVGHGLHAIVSSGDAVERFGDDA